MEGVVEEDGAQNEGMQVGPVCEAGLASKASSCVDLFFFCLPPSLRVGEVNA